MVALDASAVLAYLFREPGHEAVADLVDEGCLSSVNLAEVIGRFVRDGHDPEVVLDRLAASPIELVPYLPEDAALTAALIPGTRAVGLSLGDRACLGLAAARDIPAYTADRDWRNLDVGVRIEVVR